MKKTIENATADAIRLFYDPNAEYKRNGHREKKKNTRTGSSQSEIPVSDIVNGIVITNDGRYLGYVEVYALKDYDDLLTTQKERIMNEYTNLFKNGPIQLEIMILSDTSNPQKLINSIKRECKNKDNPQIQASLEDYLKLIRELGKNDSISHRFFIVYEYDSSMSGGWKKDQAEIIQSMIEMRDHIESIMRSCGNVCATYENRSNQTAEFLYYYHNRNTSKKESLSERYARIFKDYEEFNQRYGMHKEPTFADILAPKGAKFINRSYVYQDGLYYGYIGLNGDKWPTRVLAGKWIECFYYGAMVDIVIMHKRLPKNLTSISLKQMNRLTRQSANEKHAKGRVEASEKAVAKWQHNTIIQRALDSGEEISDDGIILVVRAKTERQLKSTIRTILKNLKDLTLEGEDSFLSAEDYYRMASPYLCFTPPFRYIKHNTLSMDMATTYCYTSFEFYDPTGYLLGKNTKNHSLVAINNFNRAYFANANMAILGKTGAGKSFTMQEISGRMFFNGIRCFFIIPKKGYEYKRGCADKNGSYVQLVPGSKDCLNILAIRPEGKIDRTMVDDEVLVRQGSLLAKKINNVIIWIQLHFQDEEDRLRLKEFNAMNTHLNALYNRFGITDDDNSIYLDKKHTILKTMPIIEDMYKEFKKDPVLDRICEILKTYITGNCKNMNGQTNVDLDNDYIVFDVDEDVIGESLLPPFLYVAFEHVYSEVKEKDKSRDAIFLDEVWKMMANKECAKQVQNAVKIVRGYGGAAIIATQELADLMKNEYGASVINGTEIRLLLGMKEVDIDLVQKTLKLTPEDCAALLKYQPGKGLLYTNHAKIEVELTASEHEFQLYNTDVNVRR